MTEQDKAKELVAKFIPAIRKYKTENPLFSERLTAKECALICVGEILSEAGGYGGYNIEFEHDSGICSPSERRFYWEEVKKEIQKL